MQYRKGFSSKFNINLARYFYNYFQNFRLAVFDAKNKVESIHAGIKLSIVLVDVPQMLSSCVGTAPVQNLEKVSDEL